MPYVLIDWLIDIVMVILCIYLSTWMNEYEGVLVGMVMEHTSYTIIKANEARRRKWTIIVDTVVIHPLASTFYLPTYLPHYPSRYVGK